MATFYSNTRNGWRLRLVVKTTSASVKDRESRVSWVLEIWNGDGHKFTKKNKKGDKDLNTNAEMEGQVRWVKPPVNTDTKAWKAKGGKSSFKKEKWENVASGAVELKHDAYGKGKTKFTVWYKTENQSASWRIPELTISENYEPEPVDVPVILVGPPQVSYDRGKNLVRVKAPMPIPGFPPGVVDEYIVKLQREVAWDNRIETKKVSMGVSSRRGSSGEEKTPKDLYSFTPESSEPYRYWISVAGKNTAGTGAFTTPTQIVVTGNGPKVLRNETWRNTRAFVKVKGRWIACICFVRRDGAWRRTLSPGEN